MNCAGSPFLVSRVDLSAAESGQIDSGFAVIAAIARSLLWCQSLKEPLHKSAIRVIVD
jgi:hypothetical protein